MAVNHDIPINIDLKQFPRSTQIRMKPEAQIVININSYW